jgi:hypothetical protein
VWLGLRLKRIICQSTNNDTTEEDTNICNIIGPLSGLPGPGNFYPLPPSPWHSRVLLFYHCSNHVITNHKCQQVNRTSHLANKSCPGPCKRRSWSELNTEHSRSSRSRMSLIHTLKIRKAEKANTVSKDTAVPYIWFWMVSTNVVLLTARLRNAFNDSTNFQTDDRRTGKKRITRHVGLCSKKKEYDLTGTPSQLQLPGRTSLHARLHGRAFISMRSRPHSGPRTSPSFIKSQNQSNVHNTPMC